MARLPANVVISFVVGVFSENVPLPSTRRPAAAMLPPVCVAPPPPTALSVTLPAPVVWIVASCSAMPVPERLRSRMSLLAVAPPITMAPPLVKIPEAPAPPVPVIWMLPVPVVSMSAPLNTITP